MDNQASDDKLDLSLTAIEDAGLTTDDVDGMVSYSYNDSTAPAESVAECQQGSPWGTPYRNLVDYLTPALNSTVKVAPEPCKAPLGRILMCVTLIMGGCRFRRTLDKHIARFVNIRAR